MKEPLEQLPSSPYCMYQGEPTTFGCDGCVCYFDCGDCFLGII